MEFKEKTKMNILIIDTNFEKDSIFQLEYINPVIKIIKENSNKNTIKILHFSKLKTNIDEQIKQLKEYEKIIISGNSLQDFKFLENIDKFQFIKYTNKDILGICAGSQIIGKIFNLEIIKKTKIGIEKNIKIENNNNNNNIINQANINEIYSLHNYYTNPDNQFETILKTTIPIFIKHKEKNIYATTFHPEIKNEQIIINFINL